MIRHTNLIQPSLKAISSLSSSSLDPSQPSQSHHNFRQEAEKAFDGALVMALPDVNWFSGLHFGSHLQFPFLPEADKSHLIICYQ